jgi:hypothetical protein
MQGWLPDRGQTPTGKASGSGCKTGLSGKTKYSAITVLSLSSQDSMASSDLKADKSSFAPLSGGKKEVSNLNHSYALGGGMTYWTASVVAILLAGLPGVASAQANCEAIPHGPARTDCYLGLSQLYRGQSDLAAARARAQSDAAWYRAITGMDPPKHKPHRRR